MSGHEFAACFVDQLFRAGVGAVCISPGSRSAPLAMAFARHGGYRVFMHIDERSGSFFGLGLARAAGSPVALLCTSGTAAAEFHPAVVEARQSRVPLVVITADRPPELRDTGANQAVDQLRLYGAAPRWFFDAGVQEGGSQSEPSWRRLAVRAVAEALGPPAGPVHLNLAFREPLVPASGMVTAVGTGPETRVLPPLEEPSPAAVQLIGEAFSQSRRPVVVAGLMSDGARLRPLVDSLAAATGAVVLAEPTSQLRVAGMTGSVPAYEALLRDPGWRGSHLPDLVLRLGAAPTSRALGRWLAESGARTLLVDPDRAWSDPDQVATDILQCDPERLLQSLPLSAPASGLGWQRDWLAAGDAAERALLRALQAGPMHEGHAVTALAAALPSAAAVVIGSSMAVRDADSFWPAALPRQRFLANRGASGIDGLVSTAFGTAAGSAEATVALIGDLTLYHDMNGLWAAHRHGLKVTFVVLDNDGGGIFSFLAQAEHPDVFEELFGTPLGLALERVADLYRLDFAAVDSPVQLPAALSDVLASPRSSLLAVRFSREASVNGHRAAWAEVEKELRSPGLPAAPGA